MNITITTLENTTDFFFPITFIFWSFVVAYVIHIIEESLIGETFVTMVRKSFWPDYQWKHFFGFNTLLMLLIIVSNIIYEIFGGNLVVLPLIFVFLLVTNGIWHFLATIITKKYSPGLVTSLIYWILFYFIVKYSMLKHEISSINIVIAAIVGSFLTVAMIGSLLIFRRKFFNQGKR